MTESAKPGESRVGGAAIGIERWDRFRDRLAFVLFGLGASMALVPLAARDLMARGGPVVTERVAWLSVAPCLVGGALLLCHLWARGDDSEWPVGITWCGFSWIDGLAVMLLLCLPQDGDHR